MNDLVLHVGYVIIGIIFVIYMLASIEDTVKCLSYYLDKTKSVSFRESNKIATIVGSTKIAVLLVLIITVYLLNGVK